MADGVEELSGGDAVPEDADGVVLCKGQQDVGLPLSPNSFRQILRVKTTVPKGRSASLGDVFLRVYGENSTLPKSYRLRDAKGMLSDAALDRAKPTVVYAHGYVELSSDESVMAVVRAYQGRGDFNIVVVDWANLGFGNYLAVALDLKPIGIETGKALSMLLKEGLSPKGLHLVGHSMGAHLLGFTARSLADRGHPVPRLTGLDPAYPGFYPAILASPMSVHDADFVDVIHTDGGGYGAPSRAGHADFWPNEGRAKQPGCISATIPLTYEDFCSHWRSWAFWAESVAGGQFLSRRCEDYDTFLRGQCGEEPSALMGIDASSNLRGNFYLRTAARAPFALGERGAE
ncbi:pancreatic lipase-related protein 3-like [Hyposmocoma kahamanoa]|uniref:pancreatic lipase-related protein 3-like n=1 Tax=Hyposmocoma kahamanoa TaxID=1477025 RepID=UPI000E6D8B85|nr:pancreatic lipase-related protein 3-like [Hyposmocoma kahamanoa]